jgi:radical SAM protein with 4Fe4S-binding SPASM domain
LQEGEFRGGSLREKSFKYIWDNAPAFRRFRLLEPSSCRRCPYFRQCHGGCPAVAYFLSGDLDSPDPECRASWSSPKIETVR